MKKSISIVLLYFIVRVSFAIAQEPPEEFYFLDDYYLVTEMFLYDDISRGSWEYDQDSLRGFFMFREESKYGVARHTVFTRHEERFAFAVGAITTCKTIVPDTAMAKRTICYDGEVLGKEFDERDGYLFVFEELELTQEQEEDGYNYASFSYFFLPNTVLQVVGYKIHSNYDPDFVPELEEHSPEKLYQIGNLMFHKKMYSLVVFYLSKALEKDSTIATTILHNMLAIAKIELLDYQGALTDYNKAIAINPNDVYSYIQRGVTKYVYLSDYANALPDLERAIELKPAYAYSHHMKGEVLYKLTQIDKACKAWSRASELGSKEAAGRIRKHCGK